MIIIEGIEKSFSEKTVLKGVSFSVEDGQIYGLVGKNGAGKTTLMSIIAGLLDADYGGFSAESRNKNSRICYLPDVPNFYDYLTTEEYLDFLLMGSNKKKNSDKKISLLTLVGLKKSEKIGAMSRGMRQRLGIAAALVNDPQVLLFDEPTSALDPAGRSELMDILKVLRDKGKSIILSTHILADMERICDKVGFLSDGIIKKEVLVQDVQNGKSSAWDILFTVDLDLPTWDNSKMSCVKVNTGRYIFETTDQKYLLQYLHDIPNEIQAIKNQHVTLDDIFQEVCL